MTKPNADHRKLDRSIQRHPTPEQLRAFGLGRLRPSEATLVEQHVETCDDCCRVLSDVPDDTVLAKFKDCDTVSYEAPADDTPVESETARGLIPLALLEHPRYRVKTMLGRGGMGVVYKAEHRLMERPVALKVISRRLIANPLAIERFQREVRAAARLTHPNIVVAHDAEQAGELHFLVMEFVDGISLAQYVERKGPLPASTASLFMRQAALGLQHAAQQGMVHRDIKPQNLMLTRKGQIKILDFGLARFAREESSLSSAEIPTFSHFEDSFEADVGLTEAGMIVGTPDYMAPEQAFDSSKADTRADIYSLGCTLYFLLSGQAPFAGDSITRTLKSHADRQPRALQTLRDDLPPELIRIVERMMAKDPAARFQSPSEVAKVLAPLATGGLAAAGTFEAGSKRAMPVLSKTPRTESEEPPTTIQLARRRHWSTLRNRAMYEYRKFFRLPHRRVLAGLCGILSTIALAAFLMDRYGSTVSNSGPPRPKLQPATPAESREPSTNVAGVVAPPATPMKPIALLVTRREFYQVDYLAVRRELESRSAAITVVSSERGWATPRGGVVGGEGDIRAELGIADVRPGQFEAIVIIPAGQSEFMSDQRLLEATRLWLQAEYDRGVPLASISNSVILLAEYGFLDGQPAISQNWIQALPRIKNRNILWTTNSERVVSGGKAGRLLTAHDASNAPALVEQLWRTLQDRNRPATAR
ncbi:MAG: protein kinase domain-containing protein [Planctomycetaceae bacterium]